MQDTISKPASNYQTSAFIAREKNITRTFVAAELKQTERAVYLYGHGTTDPVSGCARCGRTLTHPGSILIGIGPECLSKMTMGMGWELRAKRFNFENPDPADVEALKGFTSDIIIDGWFPKSSLKSITSSEELIQVPADHKMLPRQAAVSTNGKEDMRQPIKIVSMDQTGKFAIVKFDYDAKLVDAVRRLEGRKWNPDKKVWSCWASSANLQALMDLGFSLDEKCKTILKPAPKVEEVKIDEKVLDLPGLFPFQLDGVRFLEARDGNGLIGDEMGLGKTIQALGWLKLHPEHRPSCIVVPASLKINWEREARKWLGKVNVKVLSGKKADKRELRADILVINYDILGAWVDVLKEAGIKVLVCDEAHYLKNNKAQRTKAVKELQKAVPHTIFLTGTPITNRPAEFYTMLNMLAPTEFNSWLRYVKRYCNAYHDGFGWNVSGASNTEELFDKVNGILMLRRKKEDVMKQLPKKQRFVFPMDISNRKEYERAEADLVEWVREKFGVGRAQNTEQAEALARFGYLKQLAAEGKREAAMNWLKDALDSNGKLVVFGVHHTMIDYLADEMRNYNPVVVDGRVSIDKRQAAVDRFQNDPDCRLFIGNIKAAGVGLTLTAASNTVFIELGWTPGEHDQAEDRVHRIGQEADSVGAYYLVAANTIEEEIAGILDHKRTVLDAVLDGKETAEESMLTELLRSKMG